MLVLMAPDAFGGTLTAAAAAAALADGWTRARPHDDVRCMPMADGGDGTIDVVEAAVAGTHRRTAEVADARGIATTAGWLMLPDGRALIESAQACGLHQLPDDRRDPRLTTTYGVGQLIAAAVDAGVRDIIVGLGGSATVDGGAGMATALGHRLLREDTNRLKVGGEYLVELRTIVAAPATDLRVTAAVDVDAVLLGDDGAVAGFARQKGAQAGDLAILETALRTLADVAERDLAGAPSRGLPGAGAPWRDLPGAGAGAAWRDRPSPGLSGRDRSAPGVPWRDRPGAGAAGGMGFGMTAFLGASLQSGAEVVGDLIGLEAAVRQADVVVTGEGHLDRWSVRGKAPGHVATLARRSGHAMILAVAGGASGHPADLFDDIALLGDSGKDDAPAAVAAAVYDLALRLESRPPTGPAAG